MSAPVKNILLIIAIAIVNTFLLYFVKYFQNGLSLTEFSFLKTGNLISLIFLIVFVIGALLMLQEKDSFTLIKTRILITFSFIYLLPILVILIINFADFKFADEFLFGYPLKKIIPAI
ncbi:MAG: hypothetical protein HYS24_00005, partial [Ignavibacteriales bacterium]|nr:hypothetical protein [Ignavibacteriales bacterium]